MSDINETHPFKVVTDISVLFQNRKQLDALFAQCARALERARISEGAAEIRQETDEHLTVHFRTSADHDRFLEALRGKKPNNASASGPRPCTDVKKFKPDNYHVVHTVTVCDSIDPRGDMNHLVQVCQIMKCDDFRVLFEKGEINVYMPEDTSVESFDAVNEALIAEKHKEGIEISTKRTDSNTGPGIRLAQ